MGNFNSPNSVGRSVWSLRRRLFVYMLMLTVILLSILAAGLLLFGRGGGVRDEYARSLDVQMAVFEKDITAHFDSLAASAIAMSEDLGEKLDTQFEGSGTRFSELTDNIEGIRDIQALMIEPVRQKLLQARCSGAFVMLDATVNSSVSPDGGSKSGIYLQVNGYNSADRDVVLYRGIADVVKSHGIMPHRKWRLEFSRLLVSSLEAYRKDLPMMPENAIGLTPLAELPGTSDRAMFMTVPIVGKDGVFYGICGYEISESYFGMYHAQPTKLSHLSCVLTKREDGVLPADSGLICGTSEGYYRSFGEPFEATKKLGELTVFYGEIDHIGIEKNVKLTPTDSGHTLTVMIPRSDYDRDVGKSALRTSAVLVLILFFTVSFCRLFSRRFLAPIHKALDQIKSDDLCEPLTNISEIYDLWVFLESRDREHDRELLLLEEKSRSAELEKQRLTEEYQRVQGELEAVQGEIKRLAYSRKNEIDPDDYSFFVAGLKTLTETERRIFDLYLSGRSAAEILEITGVKESTLKFHNHNILGKLGVSSRKQMLRFAEVMRNGAGSPES